MKASILFASLSLAACGGGSSLDPGSGNDPGDGTSTLLVRGNVNAEARLNNARTAAEFNTDFEVRITLAGQAVTTGTVTVTSSTGTYPLAFSEEQWRGRAPGYDEVYVLDIESGQDDVVGVRVDGPDFHFFTKPTAGATVDSTMPLEVTWDASQDADSAAIRADEIEWVSIEDSNKYMLAGGSLKAERDQAKTNELRLLRVNRVVPAGAVPGSEFSVSVENRIEVVAQPNPAL